MAFFDIVLKPEETFRAEKNKASLNDALKTFAIYGAIIGFFVGIVLAVLAGLLGSLLALFGNNPVLGFLSGLGLAAIIVMPILVALWTIITSAIASGLYWLLSRLFGGKGTFEQNYFLSSRLVWPLLVAGIIITILGLIPIIGFLINIAWILYTIYLYVILVSVANQIGKLQSLIVLLIPIVIVILIALLFVGSLLAAIPFAQMAG